MDDCWEKGAKEKKTKENNPVLNILGPAAK